MGHTSVLCHIYVVTPPPPSHHPHERPHHNPLQFWSLICMDHIPGNTNCLEDAFTQLNEDIDLTLCLVHIQHAYSLSGLSNKSWNMSDTQNAAVCHFVIQQLITYAVFDHKGQRLSSHLAPGHYGNIYHTNLVFKNMKKPSPPELL